MILKYESTLADLAEPHIRLFLRSATYRKQRLYASLAAPLGFLTFVYFFPPNSASDTQWIVLTLVAVVLAAVFFFSRKYIVSNRISKYIKTEYQDAVPLTTVYTVDEQQLTSRTLGVDITFSLDDLVELVEKDGYVEVSFGKAGLCAIPIRAFDSDSQKQEFISGVRGKMT